LFSTGVVKVVRKRRPKEKQEVARILIVIVILIFALVMLIVGGGQHAKPEKFAPRKIPNPPVLAPCEYREGGANLTRFNLSNPCSLSIEDVSEVVKQWVHDNATMEDVMLAMKLWQANGSASPSR